MQTASLLEARKLLVDALIERGISISGVGHYDITCASPVASFSLSFMPGNRRTLISHAALVKPEFRGKGVGTRMNKLREEAAREAGVTLMLATVRDDNAPEIRVLEKCEWKRLTQNTETKCSLWGKQLL